MQGNIFQAIPFEHVMFNGATAYSAALLLTPTCDFALKGDHPERQVAPVEALASSVVTDTDRLPRHLFLLPPLPGLLPHGGILHFRRIVAIHADVLPAEKRAATLNARGLRGLLAAHTTYYTRSSVDPAHIHLPPDDPRLLWEALDHARELPSLARRREVVAHASALAAQALLHHHGVKSESEAQSLVLLELCAQHRVLPEDSANAARLLSAAHATLRTLYAVPPAELPCRRQQLEQLSASLEEVALVLQEPQPLQITPALLRARGLGNILPR